jgi:acetyl esterase/lipase
VKKLALLAGLTVAGLTVRGHLATRDAMSQVAPELRSPLLTLTTGPLTERKLPAVRMLFRIPTKAGRGVAVVERSVGERHVRVFVTTPQQRSTPSPAVLWLHGGGYVVGSPKFEANGAGGLARELGAVVVAPAYRLAPEHPFPAGLDDSMAALRWMRSNPDELGIDTDRIAVIGSSAGGGMAAAVAQRSHDEGIRLRAQVLVYPMLDDRSALRDHAGRGRFAWTPESNRFGWAAYLGRTPRMSDAPEYAAAGRRTDLTGLPPAWVGVGDLDLFYDEDVAYAQRLQEAGVPTELVTIPGMYHGADGVATKVPSMQKFRAATIDFLRTHL